MVRTAGRLYVSNAIRFVPDLEGIIKFEELATSADVPDVHTTLPPQHTHTHIYIFMHLTHSPHLSSYCVDNETRSTTPGHIY